MRNTVIQVKDLSKKYQLGTIGYGSLQHDLVAWWARIRHREDPNSKLGAARVDRHGEFWALKGLNFSLERGDRLGIIGRNGAGKSTLLKLLSRVTAPTEGTIRVKGRVASLLEVGTGFHPELTGRENVFLNGAILGMKRREIQAKFDEIVSFAGVEQFIETPVKRYSSGMYVRLAFSVAAHLDSEILIVDEVLAVGDAEFQKKCLGKMEDVSRGQGRTILFVSHNLAAIAGLCNKGILLSHGTLTSAGPVESIVKAYQQQSIELVKGSAQKNRYLKSISVKTIEIESAPYSGYVLTFELMVDLPDDGLGVDLLILAKGTPILYSSSAYYDPIRLYRGVQTVECRMGPVNLAAGEYTVGVNIVKPTEALLEDDPDVLRFQIDTNLAVNPYGHQLVSSPETGSVVPSQKWKRNA